jgi:soluble P-type ATPase
MFTFPAIGCKSSINWDDDLVKTYKERGYKVVYIGDSLLDYPSVREADLCLRSQEFEPC